MKTCTKCKQTKPLDKFYYASKNVDGRQSWCKQCSTEGRLAYYAANPTIEAQKKQVAQKKRRNWYTELKQGKPCVHCGGVFHPAAMHWHHLGDKVATVSSLNTHSRRTVLAEIAKCELVCANCHAVLTYTDP